MDFLAFLVAFGATLATGLAATLGVVFLCGRRFIKVDLILLALFLWIVFFFAARSEREMAIWIASLSFDLFASLIATSSVLIIILFILSFFLLDLNALLAVLVTGMVEV